MTGKRRRNSRPTIVGDLLASALQGSPAARILKEGAIWRVWDDAVGEQIASRARPASIRSGTLTVIVSSAPWMQQLNFLKNELRAKLNAAIGEEMIKEIFLKSGTLSGAEAPMKPRRSKKRRSLTPIEETKIVQAVSEIDDPGLRDAFRNLFAGQLSDKAD